MIDLKRVWNQLEPEVKGYKFGFLIGKYGLDILIPTGAVKFYVKYKILRQANTRMTLASCLTSSAKKEKILQEAAAKANQANKTIALARQGKILIKNHNTSYHILNKRHLWDKVITLT